MLGFLKSYTYVQYLKFLNCSIKEFRLYNSVILVQNLWHFYKSLLNYVKDVFLEVLQYFCFIHWMHSKNVLEFGKLSLQPLYIMQYFCGLYNCVILVQNLWHIQKLLLNYVKIYFLDVLQYFCSIQWMHRKSFLEFYKLFLQVTYHAAYVWFE